MRIIFKSVLWITLILAFAPAKASLNSLDGLTLDEKIGQLLFVGFQGEDLDQMTAAHFQKIRPGAYILFARNISSPVQVYKLNRKLQKLSLDFSGNTALIALDQEGGQVSRVPTSPGLPSPMAIGKSKNPELAKAFGAEIGGVLRSLGFNMNLAPVLDVAKPGAWDFLGSRAYGTSADTVSLSGRAFAEGLLGAGILPTAKHFPGSGGLSMDPHHSSPQSLLSKSEFMKEQLAPFKNFSDVFPSAMMISHVRYPNLDPSNLPASFSKVIANDIVRGDLNYRGLIVTDDLLMDGAKHLGGVGSAAVAAIKAGADLVMISWSRRDQVQVFDSIKRAVISNEISMAALNAKVSRILQIKKILLSQSSSFRSRIPRWYSPTLSYLETELLLNNVDHDLASRRGLINNFAPDSICVFSKNVLFQEQLRRSLNRPMRLCRNLSSLKSFLKSQTKSLAIVLVGDRKTSLEMNGLPNSMKAKILTVSSVSPGPQKSPSYWGQIYTYYLHPKLGWELGKALISEPNKISSLE